jgi:hypothetical protein
VVAGDGGCEAYTAIVWGELLSHEIQNYAEAEAVSNVEGNMCGLVMRGADALPGSKTTSRTKGTRRNLGDLTSGRWTRRPQGPHREGEEPKPVMHGREKSDLAIVAAKPTNKVERSAAEPVERRAGAKGNANQHGTHRAQNRACVPQALERIRQSSPSLTRGGSRMRESRTYGSVRGAFRNERPYRDRRKSSSQ